MYVYSFARSPHRCSFESPARRFICAVSVSHGTAVSLTQTSYSSPRRILFVRFAISRAHVHSRPTAFAPSTELTTL